MACRLLGTVMAVYGCFTEGFDTRDLEEAKVWTNSTVDGS
jgi:hypothetical protein